MKIQFLVIPVAMMFSLGANADLQRYTKQMKNGGSVTFVKNRAMTALEFSQAPYQSKPDPSWLERNFPLSKQERLNITAADLDLMTQEELDQLYIRSPAGPILSAQYQGSVLVKDGIIQNAKNLILKDSKIVNTMERFCRRFGKSDLIECLSEVAWKGKKIYPRNADGLVELRNAVSAPVAEAAKYALLPFFQTLNPSNWLVQNTEMFGLLPKYMMFPAKVYCGQSLIDHRRESVVIDYSWGDRFTPFIRGIDDLAGRGFFNIRDEIRMIRPGLYLGRAYTNKIFLLNFVLSNSTQLATFTTANAPMSEGQCFNGKLTR